MNDHEQMIISSLRYALPRRSYIMSVTDEYIENMLKGEVSMQFVGVCIEDIEQYYRDVERVGESPFESFGHNWRPLLEMLKIKIYEKTK